MCERDAGTFTLVHRIISEPFSLIFRITQISPRWKESRYYPLYNYKVYVHVCIFVITLNFKCGYCHL
jgi:hypothetical protein